MTGGAPAPARLSIDRLTLTVPAMSEADARRLAEQVAAALRDWPDVPAGARLDRVAATVDISGERAASSGVDTLAARVAAAIVSAALREIR
jgi:hypothetical protein